jgi:iron complex transport system substrate-binding protein
MSNKNYKLIGILGVLVILLLAVVAAGCTTQQASTTPTPLPTTKNITDAAGNTVTVPVSAQRIAFPWANQYELMMIAGASDKVVAIHPNVKKFVWLVKYDPAIVNVTAPFSTDVNMEDLLKTDPDLVFVLENNNATIEKCKAAGLTVVVLSKPANMSSIRKNALLIGEVLGGNSSEKLRAYDAYFGEKLSMVNATVSGIPDSQRPTVACIISDSSLQVSGKNTIMSEWITIAGGKNVANDYTGYKVVDAEQLLKWDPDVIITPSNKTRNLLMTDPMYKDLSAVKTGRVYINPHGFFDWQYPAAEEALQIQWAAQTLHPDLFPNIDMRKEVKYYHQTFLGYNLTDEEVDTILTPEVYEAT